MDKKKTRRMSEYHGILLVDKPAGITSHDVVDRVRRAFGTRRVGHAGTLDPAATGLLVMLLGEATKISEYLIGCDKSYEGTMQLGVVSDTYDAEGEIKPGPGGPKPRTMEDLQEFASDLTGEIDQVPPAYSAKKVAGRKLYEYARQGNVPEVESREISVADFEILTYEGDRAEFGVDCSSGTYVRSLVHSLGEAAGCGAILVELRRTDVGPFGIEDAITLDDLEKKTTREELEAVVVPIRRALPEMATVFLLPGAEQWVKRGQCIPHNNVQTEDDVRPRRGSLVVLCRINGQAIAIARVDPAPISPPPKAFMNSVPPWYQPIKQFDIDQTSAEE
ncbi:tRNA pseudouridine(55) synthase TruB [Candidatus Sumerlaeota bacterium]|nr:tRNA pseudouridine(55) synthase TruB [Candidatus Sumerlaeota bacterium]